MQIDEKTVTKIAKLARIKVTPEEKPLYANEISSILNWIETLSEVDTKNVEPMASVLHAKLPMREDVITEGGQAAAVVANAPKAEFDCFVVPKVVDQG